MEYFIVSAIFAAAAGSLAKGKNRSVLLWSVLGAILGPFAILAVALMKSAPGEDQGYS